MIEITSELHQSSNNVWGYYLPVSTDIVDQLSEGTDRRIKVTINQQFTIQCAFMPSKQGWFVLLNKDRKKKLNLELGDQVHLAIEKDDSEFGMEMPEELAELFRQDPEGADIFNTLTPGKQRNLLYIVNKVKNPNSRLNKALAIAQHLKESQGKLDFKILNQLIKEYNNRY